MSATLQYFVAVIGAGPAGLFGARELANKGARVILLNRDIKPGGLAEYGIYPNKYTMKSGLRKQFRQILDLPNLDYYGNITVGAQGDLTLDALRTLGVQAILVTVGAQGTKWLGLPGEDLEGVYHAKDVVYYYNHLPPFSQKSFRFGKRCAVIGAGNVMLDIAHYLIREEKVDEVIAIVRRGPAEIKFDKKEMEYVIDNLDQSALDAEIKRVTPIMQAVNQDPETARASILEALPKALPKVSDTKFRFEFLASPVQMLGDADGNLTQVELEDNILVEANGDTKAKGTGNKRRLDVETVIFAIGDKVDETFGLPIEWNEFVKNKTPRFPIDGISFESTAEDVFLSVAREVGHVFDVRLVTVCRYESHAVVVLASLGVPEFPAGSRWPLDAPGLPATIHETGRPARIDDLSAAAGLDALAREGGARAAVGVPIVVDGTVWGSINVATTDDEPLPADAEARLAPFTELVVTAVSNATMRAEVAASRARVIAAGDETRRRIERDLHDGAQQQLVTLALGLRTAEGRVPAGLEDLRTEVGGFADRLTSVVEELREMSRGIHPAALTEGGLSPALEALALRSPVPVKLNVRCERRLRDGIEVAAYYVVSEGLTNAAKHADASRVQIDLHVEEETLYLSIVDDGVGGADSSGGSGLIGLKDRVEALGGTIDVASPPGSGTRLDVEIPLLQDPPVASNSEPLSRA